MSPSPSPNLLLPLVAAAQAQKHVTVNEALLRLDALAQLTVASRKEASPPAEPVEGSAYLVPAGGEGAWQGRDGSLAIVRDGMWRFETPRLGWRAFVADEGALAAWDGSEWVAPLSLLPRLGIGQAADAGNRLSVASPATLLSHAGGDHRLSVNKAGPADTASLLFQSNYSGRAEIGLAGSDALVVKVSADGATWRTALAVDPGTGIVETPLTPRVECRQLVSAATAAPFTTSATTPAPVPGLSVTLPPRRGANRVRISGHVTLGADFASTSPQISVWRDGAKVWPQAPGAFLEHAVAADTAAAGRRASLTVPIGFLDAPAGTGALSYEVRLSSRADGFAAHVNRRDADLSPRGDSLLVAEELSA